MVLTLSSRRFLALALAPALLLGAAPTLFAQDQSDEQRRLTVETGYRWRVNFDGSEDLYRSQLDYGEGPKLFFADFFSLNSEPGQHFYDRLDFRLSNWGGEPHSSARFHMAKNEVYDFQFNYENVRYFNSIPSFANPFFNLGLESQRRFDVAQRRANFELTLRPGKRISPFFTFRRNGRRGLARTTIAADGDEFLVTADNDTHSNDFGGGVLLSFRKLSLRLEQGFRRYRDETVYSASGFQEGNSTRPLLGRDINLEEYEGRDDARVNAPFWTAAAVFQAHRTLTLRTRHSYSIADLDSSYSESIAGSFFNFPDLRIFYRDADLRTPAAAKKPTWYGDFSAEWRPADSFRLIERFRTRRFHISGAANSLFRFGDVTPAAGGRPRDQLEASRPLDTFLSVDLDIQELEARLNLNRDLFVRVGHRFERKVVKVPDRFSQDRNVLVLGAGYDFSAANRISVDYEYGRTNRPVQRTDRIDFHRLRINGRAAPTGNLRFDGLVTLLDHDDDLSAIDLASRNRNYALRFSYDPSPRFSISGGFERSSFRNDILYLVPQTLLPDRSVYREKGNYGDLNLTVFLVRDAFVQVGYSVWGTSGTFPLTSHRPTGRLEIPLTERVAFFGEWNYYGYNEKVSLFPQDYRVHLATLGLRFSLDPFAPLGRP